MSCKNAQFVRTNRNQALVMRRNVKKMGPNLTEIRRKTVLRLDNYPLGFVMLPLWQTHLALLLVF
jgi:hypothetical protein